MILNRRSLLAQAGSLAMASPFAVRAQEAAMEVEVVNATVPTLCAEEDNVYLKLFSDQVRSYRVEATHPAHIGSIVVDRWAPDFTNCTFGPDQPGFAFEPKRVTIHESIEWQLVGYVFESFWRPNLVPLRIGDTVHPGFHLIQLWTRSSERAEESLVLYPGDGYWRARPLPPRHLGWSAYGSSFLVGPVEERQRPIVDLSDLVFDPSKRRFDFGFVKGGRGALTVAKLDRETLVAEVAMDRTIPADTPFAGLRSMYVTEVNADATRIAWRPKGGHRWGEASIMDFERAKGVEIWTGRHSPSKHNTSAPDTTFTGFSSVGL